jgi:hypothetical protein
MKKRVIRLCYRKIIDVAATKAWDKLVFDDSYTEYRMQAQNFAQARQYPLFTELLQHLPEARRIDQMVSPAITGYMQQLNGVMPDILNNLGRRFVKFKNYQFEVINSHLDDKGVHRVSLSFFSEPMLWYDTVDNYLLLANNEQPDAETLTYLLQLQPYLSIYSIQEIV